MSANDLPRSPGTSGRDRTQGSPRSTGTEESDRCPLTHAAERRGGAWSRQRFHQPPNYSREAVSPRECPGRPGGLARIAERVTRRGRRHTLAPWPACWAPAAATAAGSSSAGLQVTSVAGRDFPHATQAIRGTRRVRQAGSRTLRTVTVDPGHQPAHPPGKRCPAGRLAWRTLGSRTSCAASATVPAPEVAAASHLRAGR
jgi:hypothetical protein